jgi:Spy/CpxP family protein refolding chaperone
MTTRNRSLLAVLSLAGSLLFAVGCNDASDVSQPSDPAVQAAQPVAQVDKVENDTKGPDARPEHRGHHKRGPGGHHGGPLFLLKAALHELDLSAEQKATVEGVLAKLPAPPHERGGKEGPGKEFRAALAQSIRAGKVDPTAVPEMGKHPDFAGMKAVVMEAAQTLHKALTPEQRRALVDSIAKRAEEFAPRDHDEKGARHGKRGFGGEMGPAGMFLRDLDLTDLQRDAIKKALAAEFGGHERPDAEAMKKHHEERKAAMKARLESFASDRFDAQAFAAPPKDMPAMKNPGERMHKMLAVVVPLLNETQREKLAQRIEEGPAFHRGHHGPGAPGDE